MKYFNFDKKVNWDHLIENHIEVLDFLTTSEKLGIAKVLKKISQDYETDAETDKMFEEVLPS
tara:strand:- start:252 stop:437 length:186 start_codon:yes stop_codon:yes gene_type:complete